MNPTGKGGFQKGQSGNPAGRKRRPVEERYLEIFRKAVNQDDWKEIILKAVKQAKQGDSVARKFIADYIVGAPIQRVENTGDEGGPIELLIKYVDK